jgi:large subunit ribosomal protein L21e
MVRASKGPMSRQTRRLKGKSIVTVAEYVKTFKVGDVVIIKPKAKWIGLPHLRYSNRHGPIIEARGRSYVVEVRDGNRTKKIVVSPIHLALA